MSVCDCTEVVLTPHKVHFHQHAILHRHWCFSSILYLCMLGKIRERNPIRTPPSTAVRYLQTMQMELRQALSAIPAMTCASSMYGMTNLRIFMHVSPKNVAAFCHFANKTKVLSKECPGCSAAHPLIQKCYCSD